MSSPRPVFQPLYLQVKRYLMEAVSAGEWLADESLPSEYTLADRFQVSQGTVRKALDALVAEGLLLRRQGVGTFVAAWPDEWQWSALCASGSDGLAAPERVEPELLSCGRGVASERASDMLQLRRNAPVRLVRRQLRVAGRMVGYEESVLDAERFDRLEPRLIKQYGGQMYRLYAAEFGVRVGGVQEWFVAAPADEEPWLRFPEHSPLLRVMRRACDLEGLPVEWRRMWLDSRLVQYRRL